MKVILFGATGMVGQGVLRECLLDKDVERVLVIGRRSIGKKDAKLRELIHQDFTDFAPIGKELSGFDACLFCLGVSSAGMSEADYRRVTSDFTLAAARALAAKNPGMTFVYVSGMGTDSSEKGLQMWARVKGATENALLQMPFKAAFMFRPGFIQPLHGETSSTFWTRALYTVLAPTYPVWKTLFPKYVMTTEELGRAMLRVVKHGAPKKVLESEDISALGRS
jgi:uncharacterized protein YbjT (DUF2867 family)